VCVVAACVLATSCGGGAKSAGACGSGDASFKDPGVLTFGVDESYPPFAFEDNHGNAVGLEVDIGAALAKSMKLKFAVLDRTSSVLVPLVLAHRFDVGASGFRDSPTLRKQVCESNAYMPADLGLLVPGSSTLGIKGAGDLRGRRVAVLAGGRATSWTKDHLPDVGVRVYQAEDDVLAALRDGSVDVAVDDLVLARFAQKETAGALRVAGTIHTGESYVLVTSNDNGGLTVKVDAALAKISSDGTLARIERKWLG
jgi:ABC-type amino acid transport substrate-binding protein